MFFMDRGPLRKESVTTLGYIMHDPFARRRGGEEACRRARDSGGTGKGAVG